MTIETRNNYREELERRKYLKIIPEVNVLLMFGLWGYDFFANGRLQDTTLVLMPLAQTLLVSYDWFDRRRNRFIKDQLANESVSRIPKVIR